MLKKKVSKQNTFAVTKTYRVEQLGVVTTHSFGLPWLRDGETIVQFAFSCFPLTLTSGEAIPAQESL